jgi:GNAT superfamily N-acetyltransferase
VWLPDGDFVRFLTDPRPLVAWVVDDDGVLFGHVALNSVTSPQAMRLAQQHAGSAASGFVGRLFVDPTARRQGVASCLLDRARQEAVTRGLIPMLDVVATVPASAAISLYRHAGWQEIGRTTSVLPNGQDIEELLFVGPRP